VSTGFKVLAEDPWLKKVLGGVLKVGNCLNAGVKNKERADGFYIEAL